MMADVLGGMEGTIGEGAEELPQRYQSPLPERSENR